MMSDNTGTVKIERITGNKRETLEDLISREIALKIVCNGREIAALLCSPVHLDYLAVGYLFWEGFLNSRKDISGLVVDEQNATVKIDTVHNVYNTDEGSRDMPLRRIRAGNSNFKINSQLRVTAEEVFNLVNEFQSRSEIFKDTGGVQGAALCNREKILVFADDIGRHNAIDRIFGESILKDMSTEDCMVITSGRITAEMLVKIARKGIPVFISRSAPATLGISLAKEMGMTVIGFVRGQRMNIYSNGWRVISDGSPK